jgi:hypothetical protein
MLWQLKKLSTNEPLSEAGPLPSNWGPIFGMENIQENLGDLSWLGEEFSDQGWMQIESGAAEVVQSSPAELAWEKAKELLRQSDWAVLSDVPMTVGQRQTWVEYRAKLRDIRMQPNFPNAIAWPTKPE